MLSDDEEIRVSTETLAPCCTTKSHKGWRDRKTGGRHPEADLGNLMVIINHSAGTYKIYRAHSLCIIYFSFNIFLTSSCYCTLSRSVFGKAEIQLIRIHTNCERQRRKTLQSEITLIEYCLIF